MSALVAKVRRAERGAALVALVLTLAGGALLWFAATDEAALERRVSARDRLLAARRALLSHVAAYPDVYGPRGAGPAHLPCPDTDTSLVVGTLDGRDRALGAAGATSAFAGDGPNPPCGGGALAVGRLPRHVTLSTHREAFHHEPAQRFLYALSTNYVNNPVGRPVGPDRPATRDRVMGDRVTGDRATGDRETADDRDARTGEFDATVAVIVDAPDTRSILDVRPGSTMRRDDMARRRASAFAATPADLAHRATARGDGHVGVHRVTLLDAARRRVSVWFVDTATDAALARCAANAQGERAFASICPFRSPARHFCDEPNERTLLAWLADETSQPEVCGGGASAPPVSIENVPSEHHWFVRNGWHRAVSVEVDADCDGGGAFCRLRDVDGGGPGLAFRLEPVAAGERR